MDNYKLAEFTHSVRHWFSTSGPGGEAVSKKRILHQNDTAKRRETSQCGAFYAVLCGIEIAAEATSLITGVFNMQFCKLVLWIMFGVLLSGTAFAVRSYTPYNSYAGYKAYKTGPLICSHEPSRYECRGTRAHCESDPGNYECRKTEAHCESDPGNYECRKTRAHCESDPGNYECRKTEAHCESAPSTYDCRVTKAHCENEPTTYDCRGTPAHCAVEPGHSECRSATPCEVDPTSPLCTPPAAVDAQCRYYGYTR